MKLFTRYPFSEGTYPKEVLLIKLEELRMRSSYISRYLLVGGGGIQVCNAPLKIYCLAPLRPDESPTAFAQSQMAG